MTADMHVHTLASDGRFTPEDVVNGARNAGLSLLAATDHDTVFNTEKVNTLCVNAGIKGVNGVEISAYADDVKIHTLGYGFNPQNAEFKSFMDDLQRGSVVRAEQIISKLSACGVKLSVEEAADERFCGQTPIHAMHIARAAAKKGYAANPVVFYNKFLAYGRPAYSNICRPAPEEAIQVINSAGGIAVIAHPGRIDLNKNELYMLISRLVRAGLGGIEAVYSTHTDIQTAYFKEIAEEFGLFVTGGSDTHCSGGSRRIGLPTFRPSEALLRKLKIC